MKLLLIEHRSEDIVSRRICANVEVFFRLGFITLRDSLVLQ